MRMSHDLRGDSGIMYHDLYIGGKALVEKENVSLDLTKSNLCPSFVEDLTAKDMGLRMADSHTGNHHKYDFTPLEAIRRFLCIFGSRSLSSLKERPSSRKRGNDTSDSRGYLARLEAGYSEYIYGYFVILMIVLRSDSLYVNGCYTSIISFGDSLADTGSQKELSHISHQLYPCLYSPYGETFFHKPTGRCSNGRLIIDFLAESLGLPMIQPFLHNKHTIDDRPVALRQGVNYAVAG
nr:GDSL esterase/lipase At1g28580-like [Tanacetum cinerariifolium]